jgi:hypothetical protein
MQKILIAVLIGAGVGALLLLVSPRTALTPLRPRAGVVYAPERPPADAAAWREAFPLEPPDLPPLTGVPTERNKALATALIPFREKRYQEAAPLLEQVASDYPGAEALLYLGIARLFTDEIPNGIEILRQAQASSEPHLAATAQWYALVGIARLREPASSLAEVREVCAKPGPFQARACAALDALKGGASGRGPR